MKYVGKQGAASASATRTVAKDRLSLILASQRGSELINGVNMEDLQRDVLQVVERHIKIAQNRPANFTVSSEGDIRLFEISVELASRQNAAESSPTQRAAQELRTH